MIRRYDFDTEITKLTDVGKFMSGKQGRMTKETICEILNELSWYSYDTQSFTYEELKDELDNLDIQNLLLAYHQFSEFFKLKEGIDLYLSHGYCQGDATYVLCKAETSKNYHHLIDRELWDCPVWANVQIADCEYRYDELMSDQYYWDKPKYIEEIVKAHTNDVNLQNKLKEQLNRLLPEELDYV